MKTYGAKGRQILRDAQSEADGINAYWKAHNINQAPATVNDVIAVTAFIGSIFGAGGGAEASNADFLAKLQNELGTRRGRAAWDDDAMLFNDPEAPTTTKRTFSYPVLTGGKVRGSLVIDAGSIVPLDPRQTPSPATDPVVVDAACRTAAQARIELPGRRAEALGHQEHPGGDGSSARLLLPGDRRTDGSARAGLPRPRRAVPGLSMYILIGRTQSYGGA